jgi:hypothetical protein
MRLRFSLRLVFVAATLVAIALYWFIVRPTAMANLFTTAVRERDYATARSLLHDDFWALLPQPKSLTESIDLVYAEVLPREWSDIWHCQRRIILRVGRHADGIGRHVEWTEDTDVVAHINSLEKDVRYLPGSMTD